MCSVLAVVAYRYGDGALSQVAIDRCLAAEAENTASAICCCPRPAPACHRRNSQELAGADPTVRRRPRPARRHRPAG